MTAAVLSSVATPTAPTDATPTSAPHRLHQPKAVLPRPKRVSNGPIVGGTGVGVRGTGVTEDAPGISFDPRPPQAGQATSEIVDGFFEAMTATPVSARVARQFLTREAAEAWVPEQQIITYSELGDATAGTSVRVPLTDVNLYDARGAWQRTRGGATLSLGLVKEDGEWRIDEVPDALIVPESTSSSSHRNSSGCRATMPRGVRRSAGESRRLNVRIAAAPASTAAARTCRSSRSGSTSAAMRCS